MIVFPRKLEINMNTVQIECFYSMCDAVLLEEVIAGQEKFIFSLALAYAQTEDTSLDY